MRPPARKGPWSRSRRGRGCRLETREAPRLSFPISCKVWPLVPGLPSPLALCRHLLPPPAPSSSGSLQFQGPRDWPALLQAPKPFLVGEGLSSPPWSRVPAETSDPCSSPRTSCWLLSEAGASGAAPAHFLPPCQCRVGGSPGGPLTREGGQPSRDKARLGSWPPWDPRTWDAGECLRAPSGLSGP